MPPREPTSSPPVGDADRGTSVDAGLPIDADAASAGTRPGESAAPSDAVQSPAILDLRRTARRLAVAVGAIGTLVVVTWVVLALTTGAPLRLLAELAGLGLLGAFVVEVVVVGGSALRGMLTAGEHGERLAASDVSLVPPQLLRRRRR